MIASSRFVGWFPGRPPAGSPLAHQLDHQEGAAITHHVLTDAGRPAAPTSLSRRVRCRGSSRRRGPESLSEPLVEQPPNTLPSGNQAISAMVSWLPFLAFCAWSFFFFPAPLPLLPGRPVVPGDTFGPRSNPSRAANSSARLRRPATCRVAGSMTRRAMLIGWRNPGHGRHAAAAVSGPLRRPVARRPRHSGMPARPTDFLDPIPSHECPVPRRRVRSLPRWITAGLRRWRLLAERPGGHDQGGAPAVPPAVGCRGARVRLTAAPGRRGNQRGSGDKFAAGESRHGGPRVRGSPDRSKMRRSLISEWRAQLPLSHGATRVGTDARWSWLGRGSRAAAEAARIAPQSGGRQPEGCTTNKATG